MEAALRMSRKFIGGLMVAILLVAEFLLIFFIASGIVFPKNAVLLAAAGVVLMSAWMCAAIALLRAPVQCAQTTCTHCVPCLCEGYLNGLSMDDLLLLEKHLEKARDNREGEGAFFYLKNKREARRAAKKVKKLLKKKFSVSR